MEGRVKRIEKRRQVFYKNKTALIDGRRPQRFASNEKRGWYYDLIVPLGSSSEYVRDIHESEIEFIDDDTTYVSTPYGAAMRVYHTSNG